MKHYIILLIIIFPLTVFGQIQKIKVVNAVTHKPVNDIWIYILEDNDKWVGIGHTNKEGMVVIKLSNLDSASSFQMDMWGIGFKPFFQDINPFDNKTLTVTIIPDSTFSVKKKNLVYLGCSSKTFGFYYPKKPHSVYDLPDNIRIKLEAYLIDRLGQDYYSKLSISGGQIVNLDRLYIVNKNAKNYQWTPYSYYLCFSFKDTIKGIGLYTAKIILDKYGNVIKDIKLPNINDHPEKATIIPLEQAKEIAIENKFYNDKTIISLSYDDKYGSITWCFEQITFNPDNTTSIWKSVIDAHNGEIIKNDNHGGIWN